MPRQPRIDLPGVAQHIVQRGNDRQPCFFEDIDRIRYLHDLRDIARRESCRVHAYVPMTNHVHLPVTPAAACQAGRMMQALGRRYVRYVNERYRRTGTLWEGRYKACPVVGDHCLLRCQRYIELNPARARMVADPAGYRWSSHPGNTAAPADPLLAPHLAWLALGDDAQARRQAWRAWVMQAIGPEETDAIHEHLQRQRPYGPKDCRREIEDRLGRSIGPKRIGRPCKPGGRRIDAHERRRRPRFCLQCAPRFHWSCMDIVVVEELKAYIDPLTTDEYEALERSLLAEGCRDALVVWGDILVDGHNRYGLCRKHGLPFNIVQNTRFQSMEDVHLWMIEQHLGRRSVSDYQRGVLALRKRAILGARQRAQRDAALAGAANPDDATASADTSTDDRPPWDEAPAPVSRAELAREAKLSSNQVVMIERIQAQATPELVEALKAGEISISAAAAVASLPEHEQRNAAQAGKAELRQAARRARDAKKRPKGGADADRSATGDGEASAQDPKALQRRILELERENTQLRSQVETLQNQLTRLRS